MPQIKELLSRFNLSEQETDVYLALLTLGKAGATQIAKKIQTNRTAVYFHLNHLLEKKFVSKIHSGKAISYIATPPTDLAETFDRWTTDFKSLIPWMESLKKVETETPRIEVSDSKNGYYQLYDEISSLPMGSMIRVLEGREAVLGEFSALSQEQWQTFFKRLVERKIKTKALFTNELMHVAPTRMSKKTQELLRERIWHLRLIPEQLLPFQKLLMIYGKKISFVFPSTSLVVTIDHREIVEAIICMFDGLYQLGKPSTHP
ncbi:BlaI/MecI/CopY family transcriptional regulator [Patescibacteria group bacterium]|nr:BlaI/MecI/CopY family transcriptional regulator [Patescibacteria group bacterium]